MIRSILCLIGLLFLQGCADRIIEKQGAEAVIYPELQRFNIEFKNNDVAKNQQQLISIIDDMLPVSPDTQWIITYRLKRDADVVNNAVMALKVAGVIPDQISVAFSPKLSTDIALEVRQYRLITSTCQPFSFDNNQTKSGCFVDVLRMQQVVSPSRLINEIKE